MRVHHGKVSTFVISLLVFSQLKWLDQMCLNSYGRDEITCGTLYLKMELYHTTKSCMGKGLFGRI